MAFDSHLSRAKWMTEHGYRLLLREGASVNFTFSGASRARIESENRTIRENRVTVEDAAQVRDEESTVVRLHLNRVPGRVAARVAAESNAAIVEEIVQDEINNAMAAICIEANEGVEHDHDSKE
jgi:hypothetical protein